MIEKLFFKKIICTFFKRDLLSPLIWVLLFSLILVPNFFSASALKEDPNFKTQSGVITVVGSAHIYGLQEVYVSTPKNNTLDQSDKKASQEIISKKTDATCSENIVVSKGASIYVADNAVFSGKIIYVDSKPEVKALKKKVNYNDLIKKAIAQKVGEKIKADKLQENIAEKFNCRFSDFPLPNSDFSQKNSNSIKATFTPLKLLQKSAISAVNEKTVSKISNELKRQKFYTSLSHLQFRKYRDNSLRAPPFTTV